MKALNLPDAFEKYTLTTDIPFQGIRTTKAKIEPVKSLANFPKTTANFRMGDEMSGNMFTPKKSSPIRSKSKLNYLPSSTLNNNE